MTVEVVKAIPSWEISTETSPCIVEAGATHFNCAELSTVAETTEFPNLHFQLVRAALKPSPDTITCVPPVNGPEEISKEFRSKRVNDFPVATKSTPF